MQRLEFLVLIHKPEVAHHHALVIFGLRQVGIHLLGIEIHRIDMINRELTLHTR